MPFDEAAFEAWYGSYIKKCLPEEFIINYKHWKNSTLEEKQVKLRAKIEIHETNRKLNLDLEEARNTIRLRNEQDNVMSDETRDKLAKLEQLLAESATAKQTADE
jgi:hypothetical protein